MNKRIICAALGAALLSFAAIAADEEIDITAAVRAAGKATITNLAGTPYPGGYDVDKMFNGDTAPQASAGRAMFNALPVQVQYDIADDFQPDYDIIVTSYTLIRGNCSLGTTRAPGRYKLEALVGEEWVTLHDFEPASCGKWSEASRSYVIEKPLAARSYRFTLLANSGEATTPKVSMTELILNGQIVPHGGTITVASTVATPDAVVCDPAPGVYAVESQTLTSAATVAVDGFAYDCLGYKLEKKVEGDWVEEATSSDLSYSYVQGDDDYRLTWLYSDTWNGNTLSPVSVKEAVEKAGGTVDCGGSAYLNTAVAANAFNGVKYCIHAGGVNDSTQRYLGSIKNGTELHLSYDPAVFEGKRINVVGYRLWQLSCGSMRNSRAPSAWTLYGSTTGNDGDWQVIDQQSDYQWYSHIHSDIYKDENSPYNLNQADFLLNSATFELPAANQFGWKYLKWVPSASYTGASEAWPVGLAEIEFLIMLEDASAGKLVKAANVAVPGITDGYGDLTASGTVIAPEYGFLDGFAYRCTGFTLETADASGAWTNPVTHDGELSYEYVQGKEMLRITFNWEPVGAKLTLTADNGKETFTTEPAADWTDDEGGRYFTFGKSVEVTPVGATEPTASSFNGIVTGGEAAVKDNKVTVTVGNGPIAFNFGFSRHWTYREASADTQNVPSVTDGNWVFRLQTHKDFTGADAQYNGWSLYERQAGSGRLDLSTLNEDIEGTEVYPIKCIDYHFMEKCAEVTDVTVPADIPGLLGLCFARCSNLTNVVCRGTLEDYNFRFRDGSSCYDGAFLGCTSLRNLSMSEATTIPHHIADGCLALKSVALPATVTNIQRAAFNGSGLERVTWEGTPDIGSYAFAACASLRSCPSFAGIKSIGERAFNECANLEATADFSELTYLGDRAFRMCVKLTGTADLRNVKEFQNPASNGAFIQAGITGLELDGNPVRMVPGYFCYKAASLASVSLGNTMTNIGNCAFLETSALTSIAPADFASSIETLGFAAFRNSNLAGVSVIFGKALKTIEGFYPPEKPTAANNDESGYTFANTSVRVIDLSNTTITGVPDHFCSSCVALEELRLPKTFTTLGTTCFGTGYTDMTLTKILFAGLPPTTVPDDWSAYWDGKNNVLAGRDYKMVVGMPTDSLAAWQADANFVPLAEIDGVETKPNYEAVKAKYKGLETKPNYEAVKAKYKGRLLGTWKGKWAVSWTPSHPLVIIIK